MSGGKGREIPLGKKLWGETIPTPAVGNTFCFPSLSYTFPPASATASLPSGQSCWELHNGDHRKGPPRSLFHQQVPFPPPTFSAEPKKVAKNVGVSFSFFGPLTRAILRVLQKITIFPRFTFDTPFPPFYKGHFLVQRISFTSPSPSMLPSSILRKL